MQQHLLCYMVQKDPVKYFVYMEHDPVKSDILIT